jgi:hypothetical protein
MGNGRPWTQVQIIVTSPTDGSITAFENPEIASTAPVLPPIEVFSESFYDPNAPSALGFRSEGSRRPEILNQEVFPVH